MITNRRKLIAISILTVLILTGCATNSRVPYEISSIQTFSKVGFDVDPLDPKSICSTLFHTGNLTPSDLKESKTEDIKRLNFLLKGLLERMESENLIDSEKAAWIRAVRLSLGRIETKSPDMKLYDAAAEDYHNLFMQPLDPYCDAWYNNLNAITSPRDDSNDASTNTQSDDEGNNCLNLQVESPYDSGDFYAFQVYITNNCSYRVSIKGYFYVKTIDGSIYERPSDATINFHGRNICGINGNYFDYTFNPGSTGEYSSDSVCNSVYSGKTVVSYYIANNPDGKPSLELNGRWTLD
jgi:hypothetical protein